MADTSTTEDLSVTGSSDSLHSQKDQLKETVEPDEIKVDAKKGSSEVKATVSGSVNANIGKVEAEKNLIAQTINEQNIKNIFMGISGQGRERTLNLSYCKKIPRQALKETAKSFVQQGITCIDTALEIIGNYNMLFIAGKADCGKLFLAKYLTDRILCNLPHITTIQLVDTLSTNVDADLQTTVIGEAVINERVIIFKDMLAGGNPQISRFIESLSDEHDLNTVCQTLKSKSLFIIGTINSSELKRAISSSLKPMVIYNGLPAEGIESYLNTQITQVSIVSKHNISVKGISSNFACIRDAITFVTTFLNDVCTTKISIEEAIRLSCDPGQRIKTWFKSTFRTINNDEDILAWSFTVCLALTGSTPWLRFHRFWKAFVEELVHDLNLPPENSKGVQFPLSLSPILTRCRAHIVNDLVSGTDIVEFTDVTYATVIRSLLHEEYLPTVSSVQHFIERFLQSADIDEQKTVARCLGRIGSIDPEELTEKYFQLWMNSGETDSRQKMSSLFIGIFESGANDYIIRSKTRLQNYALHGNAEQQLTAIVAFKCVASLDLAFAIGELRKISYRKLIERSNALQRFGSIVSSSSLTLDQAIGILQKEYIENAHLMSAIRYSIIAMCLEINTISVIDELRKWIIDYGNVYEALVVLFFLDNDGIAENIVRKGAMDEKTLIQDKYGRSAITMSICSGTLQTKKYAIFIRDVFAGISHFPLGMQASLKNALIKHVNALIADCLAETHTKSTIVLFLSHLYQNGSPEFKKILFDERRRWDAADNPQLKEVSHGFLSAISGFQDSLPIFLNQNKST